VSEGGVSGAARAVQGAIAGGFALGSDSLSRRHSPAPKNLWDRWL